MMSGMSALFRRRSKATIRMVVTETKMRENAAESPTVIGKPRQIPTVSSLRRATATPRPRGMRTASPIQTSKLTGYGPETTVPEHRRLVCSKCGSRAVDFVLIGARR